MDNDVVIKDELKQPYTEEERLNFIVKNNHTLGYTIDYTDDGMIAYIPSDKELQEEAEQIEQRMRDEFYNQLVSMGIIDRIKEELKAELLQGGEE